MHFGRKLSFHTMDGTVKFEIEPQCGMPQGAPDSPMIYSVLMEELLSLAEAHLRVNT